MLAPAIYAESSRRDVGQPSNFFSNQILGVIGFIIVALLARLAGLTQDDRHAGHLDISLAGPVPVGVVNEYPVRAAFRAGVCCRPSRSCTRAVAVIAPVAVVRTSSHAA